MGWFTFLLSLVDISGKVVGFFYCYQPWSSRGFFKSFPKVPGIKIWKGWQNTKFRWDFYNFNISASDDLWVTDIPGLVSRVGQGERVSRMPLELKRLRNWESRVFCGSSLIPLILLGVCSFQSSLSSCLRDSSSPGHGCQEWSHPSGETLLPFKRRKRKRRRKKRRRRASERGRGRKEKKHKEF